MEKHSLRGGSDPGPPLTARVSKARMEPPPQEEQEQGPGFPPFSTATSGAGRSQLRGLSCAFRTLSNTLGLHRPSARSTSPVMLIRGVSSQQCQVPPGGQIPPS